MRTTLTILEDHLAMINRDSLQKANGAYYILCGTSNVDIDIWDGEPELRFLSKYLIHTSDQLDDAYSENVSTSFNEGSLNQTIEKAEQENLNICFVRIKSCLQLEMSNDAKTLLFTHEVEDFVSCGLHVIVIYIGDEGMTSFIRTRNNDLIEMDLIRVIGKKFSFFYPDKFILQTPTEFSRQQLAFGNNLTIDLSKLRVGVVGCGATGSATSHMLTRLGVGHLLLIDKDVVESSNLNRLYGATMEDAENGTLKVSVLKKFLNNIGLKCNIVCIEDWVGSHACQDALKSCDIVFSCTDDNSGRILMNRLAYFYHIPVIDMGLEISLTETEPKMINAIMARVTVVFPGKQCLLCRKVVNTRLAREESLKRSDPEAYQSQKMEAYVTGEGNPSPAVITFTTEASTMAVNELLHRLTGFKNSSTTDHFVNFINVHIDETKYIRKPGSGKNEDCPICSKRDFWGIGDVTPFLDIAN